MPFFILMAVLSSLFIGCSGGVKKEIPPVDISKLSENQPEVHGTLVEDKDIVLNNPLNQDWVSSGKNIYELKCLACHRLNEERLVGPGWAGVTKTRKPAWIINMITNVDVMLETDEEAQKLLEQCLVRMPNQNISAEESRHILEFMFHNDGQK
ncbi:MAG: c-type cytochrome [Saprospiraceae bacterium]|nr:c-type cytochrome [Saprospiraceae bacterium]